MIHPSAIVHPNAKIGENVEIGPFCTVGENVEIGEGTRLLSSVVLDGWTTLGKNNLLYPGVVIGVPPQDFSYKGQRSYVRIGDNNEFREYVTIHRAATEEGVTAVGNGNLLMGYVHIAHNCSVGNQVTAANYAGMAGHSSVGDQAVLGGLVGIHQHTKIGRLCMVGGCSKINKDLPPFSVVDGNPCRIFGINFRGMRRRGIDKDARLAIQTAMRFLASSGMPVSAAMAKIEAELPQCEEIQQFLDFLRHPSPMGILNKAAGVGSRAKQPKNND